MVKRFEKKKIKKNLNLNLRSWVSDETSDRVPKTKLALPNKFDYRVRKCILSDREF